ncbi:MAG: hypothetical protein QNJ46_33830 [Leptolyngbyaceae cyanobacterium MO_188.B28]|nr:hypothetical protein [Leptolyngbyaceae cyanobacterium MO_188.B28]
MNPFRLLWDSVTTFSSAYPAVLILNLPFLLIDIADFAPFPAGSSVFIRSIFFFVLLPWCLGATVFYFYQSTQQQTHSLQDAVQHAFSCWPRLILSSFLLVLPLVVAYYALFNLSWSILTLEQTIFQVLGFIVVMGLYWFSIYIELRIVLVPCLVALENTTIFESLRRSWKLTQGHWKLIIQILAVGFSLWGIAWRLQIPALTLVIGVVGSFLELALNFLVRPVVMGYYLLLYIRLKTLTEE